MSENPRAKGGAAEGGDERPIRILVVDDAAEARILLRLLLNDPAQFTVETAENGPTAIDMHEAAPFDLILLDILMPKIDGYRTAKEIRSWEVRQGRRRTPIVAISATEPQEGRQRSLQAGMDGFLSKPIKKDGLLKVIDRLVKALRIGDRSPGRV